MASTLKRLRIAFSIAVLVAAVAVAWAGTYVREWRVCEEQMAQVGDDPRVGTCRPLRLTDPPIVLTVVLGAALLLPDFSRIVIPGILELERTVERQASKQEDLARQVSELRVAQAVRVSQVSIDLPHGFDVGALLESISAKEKLFEVSPDE